MAPRHSHRKVVECAHMLLDRAREYACGVDPSAPTGSGDQLSGACEWIPGEAEQAISNAALVTFGSVADQWGLEQVKNIQELAEGVLPRAGELLVFAADDWFDHAGNPEAIRALAEERPDDVEARHWIDRWLDRQPDNERSLLQVAEAAAAALSVVIDRVPGETDSEIVVWWVGSSEDG